MLEKYHDLKWNHRQFGSFKILWHREGWSFQRRKTEPTCESGGSSWWGCSCRTSLVSWRKQERRLHHHQLHMYSCNPTEQLPGAEHRRRRGVHREPSGHQHKWTPLLGVKHDLTLLAGSQNRGPGGLRALGLLPPRPTCTHLAPPHGHCVSFLLPPTSRAPIPWAPGSSHSSHHFISHRPSSFVGSEPTTHSLARSDGKSSFWDRRLARRQSFALSVGSQHFSPPLQGLWNYFHANRAWWTLFSLPIYIVRNKTLLV